MKSHFKHASYVHRLPEAMLRDYPAGWLRTRLVEGKAMHFVANRRVDGEGLR